MQNTLPITPGNPLRNVTGLARQISLPGEHAPLRFPSFPALERTAVMGFNQPATLAVPANTSTALTVFRQATYPVWADQSLQYVYLVDYQTVGAYGIVGTANYEVEHQVLSWTTTTRLASSTVPGLTASASSLLGQPPQAIMGVDSCTSGPEYTFVPGGSTLYLVLSVQTTITTAVGVVVTLEEWNSPGETGAWAPLTGGISAGGQSMMFSLGSSAVGRWIRPQSCAISFGTATNPVTQQAVMTLCVVSGSMNFTSSGTSAGQLTPTFSTVVSHFPLVYPVEFSNSALPWYATRVTAAALLCTNVTQVLNKGGTVLAGRVSPAVQNAWKVSYSYINGLHPAEKAYLPLETGLYTYCPPSTDLVFFGDYTLNTAFAAPAPVFLLSNDSLYNKVFLTAPVASSMACTCTWHIEFRTSSSLFQVGLSGMTLEALHQAQLVLAESGFFFENIEHKQLLAKVVSMAKKYVPEAVSVINPTAGKMLQSLVSRMSNKGTVTPKPGPSKPATTSAKASGITAKPAGKGSKKGKGKGKTK